MTNVDVWRGALAAGGGRTLWSSAAFLFPTLAVVQDHSIAAAMLLFLLETLCASALLYARVVLGGRASSDPGASARISEVGRGLLLFVAPFSIGPAVLLTAVAVIAYSNGQLLATQAADASDRATWMALMLLASAVADSLLAPVRSVQWLETAAAWQFRRTAVMMLVLIPGWPIMIVTGTLHGFAWAFFALRLLTDLSGLRARDREHLRQQVFGDVYTPPQRVGALGEPSRATPP